MDSKEFGLERYKKRFRILEALAANTPPVTLQDIADQLGITVQAVRKTFLGDLHSQRILDAFRQANVPEKYLFDPRKNGVQMKNSGQPAVRGK